MTTRTLDALIWYPVGNHFQLLDIENDPCEMQDLSGVVSFKDTLEKLNTILHKNLYGTDNKWLDGV